jgi:hypothetical protein
MAVESMATEAAVDNNEQSAGQDSSEKGAESEGSYLDIPAFLRKQAE